LKNKSTIVLKFGSATITDKNGLVDIKTIEGIAAQVVKLKEEYNIVIVSSGAVAAGKAFIENYTGLISERKAAAAIGNPLLMSIYRNAFQPHGITVAQSLCERSHFANRKQFLQLKDTFNTLWKSGIIPIANENDVVSDLELKLSDNDELATLLALAFDATVLMIGSGVEGLLNKKGVIVNSVVDVNEEIFSLVAERALPLVGAARLVLRLELLQEHQLVQLHYKEVAQYQALVQQVLLTWWVVLVKMELVDH
jgi:glutamate 5-kinase